MSRLRNSFRRRQLRNNGKTSRQQKRSLANVRPRLSLEALDERALMAADLAVLDEGLQDGFFSDLQQTINTDVLSVQAPLVGDALAREIGGTSDNSSQFVASVGQKLQAVSLDGDVTIGDVKSELSSALGISQDAIDVIGQDGDSDIRFRVSLSDVQRYAGAVELDLVGADPELELLLGTENQVDLDLAWNYELTFGVREDAAGDSMFYMDTSANDELSIDYTATVRDDFDAGKGRVGVFVAQFGASDETSQFVGSYALDLDTDQAGVPTVTGSLTGTGEAHLDIDAAFFPSFLPKGSEGLINLGVLADGRVTYDTDLVFTDGGLDATGNEVTVGFDDVRLDLGKLYNDFVDPLITNIQNNLRPIKPAIDFLTEPVPVISDLFELGGSGPVTALTLGGYGPNDPIVKTINVIDAILDYRGLPGAGAESPESLFSFEVSKQGVDPVTAQNKADTIRKNIEKLEKGELRLELADKHKNPQDHAKWEKSLSWNTEFGGSISLPFLTDFETLTGFLLGDTSSELLTFDIAASFSFTFDVSLPIAPLLNLVQLNAGFGFHGSIDLDGGYDALGIQRLTSVADFSSEQALQQSLQDNQEFLVHGFYLDDHNENAPGDVEHGDKVDKPEVTLGVTVSGGLSAGVDLVLLAFKLGGNVVFEGNLEFDLNDLPDPNHDPTFWPNPSTPIWSNYDTPNEWNYDGRVRVNEFTTIVDADPGALFNIDGNLQVGLDATLEVSVIGITIISEKWELFRVTLVDGSISRPDDAEIIRGFNPPQIGEVNNGILSLFMGSSSNRRTNAEPHVTDEAFVIQSLGESKNGGETLMVVFESTSGEKYTRIFDGVTQVVGSGGSGNDSIRILPGVSSDLELSGGSGDDLLSSAGSGSGVLYGNDGSDTLIGGSGSDQLVGGTGEDHLDGGSGNDTLDGGAGNDRLLGSAGDDNMQGGADEDHLDGGHGDDQLYGGAGNDTLRGGAGSDTVDGQAGDDRIQFGFFLRDASAVDQIRGGENSDIVEIYGTEKADTFSIQQLDAGTFQVTNGAHASFGFSLPEDARDRDIEELRISGLGGDDTIQAVGSFNVSRLHLSGGEGNDTLTGSDSRDLLTGGAGDDTLNGGGDQDELHGGDGDDTLRGGADNDALYGESGNDWIYGETGSDTSFGGQGNDTIEAGNGWVGDSIDGGSGDDTLRGGPGIDTIRGGDGRDRIEGGGLDDALFGDAGDDLLVGGTGRDLLDGGSGHDELVALDTSFESISAEDWDSAIVEITNSSRLDTQTANVNALLAHLAVNDPHEPDVVEQRQQLSELLSARRAYYSADEREVVDSMLADIDPNQTDSLDRLLGGAGDDRLYGTRYSDLLHGGAGSDEIHGETGDDRIQFDSFHQHETDPGDGAVDHVFGVNSDILEILGTDEDDSFLIQQLSSGLIQLTNGQGESFRFGSPSDQGFKQLRISGLGGDDTIEAVGHFDIGLRLDGGAGNDLIIGGNAADILHGGPGADDIYGGPGNDEIDGGDGDDTLSGEAGDDVLVGGTGRDIVQGGQGEDQLFALDATVELGLGFASDFESDPGADADPGTDELSTQITITELLPADDLVNAPTARASILEDQDASRASRSEVNTGAARGPSQRVRVDELDGGDGEDRLRGSDDFDRLRGGAGNDVIVHSLGDDHVVGGSGDADRYTFLFTDDNEFIDVELDSLGEVIVSRSLDGLNRKAQAIGKANHLEIEVVGIEANGGADHVIVDLGEQAVMQVHINGGAGNDTFDVSALPHNATLVGDSGHDTLIVRAKPGVEPTNFKLADDKLEAGVIHVLQDVEAAELTGNDGNNVLDATHFSGSVKLFGAGGDDTLWGSKGDDILDGGSGTDIAGAQADTNFTLTDSQLAGSGTDVLSNIEAAEIVGGASNNVIDARAFSRSVTIRGGSGADFLYGGTAADTIFGGDGNDEIFGGAGNDTLHGENHHDKIRGEDGDDWLYGGAVYDYVWGGAGSDTIRGGSGDDRLYGNNGQYWASSQVDGHDTIYGEDGYDHIWGEAGNDTLDGGNHNDTIYGNDGADWLYGRSGNDRLLGGNHNDHLYGESGNDYLSGEDGHDTLDGGHHNDSLIGGTGNDSLYGNYGSDYLYGESGNDYLDGGRDGTWDHVDGGSGWDRGVQHRRWVGWWIFAYWENQDSLYSIESTSYSGW